MRYLRQIALATILLTSAASAKELDLPPSNSVPGMEELSKAGPIANNPEWGADEIGMDVDTYLAEDRGFKAVQLFIRQDTGAKDYALVRDKLLAEILPTIDSKDPIGLSFVALDVTGDGLDEMLVQITSPKTCSEGDGCRTLVFSFDDEKAWRILLDVRTQEVSVRPGWDEEPSKLATINERDGVRFWKFDEGRFVAYDHVKRTPQEIQAAIKAPAPQPPPPGR